jgi:hypothetical protein
VRLCPGDLDRAVEHHEGGGELEHQACARAAADQPVGEVRAPADEEWVDEREVQRDWAAERGEQPWVLNGNTKWHSPSHSGSIGNATTPPIITRTGTSVRSRAD